MGNNSLSFYPDKINKGDVVTDLELSSKSAGEVIQFGFRGKLLVD
jgi:hypothetical protein